MLRGYIVHGTTRSSDSHSSRHLSRSCEAAQGYIDKMLQIDFDLWFYYVEDSNISGRKMLPFTADRSNMNRHCKHRWRKHILIPTMPIINMMRKSYCSCR